MTVFTLDDLERAKRAAHSQVGDPYKWGGSGPNGFDCSGFMSYLLNVLEQRDNLYLRRFSTGTFRDHASMLGFTGGMGDANDFSLGFMYPWESSSGIGHVAGTLGGLNVESRGSRGVLVGSEARGATAPLFSHHFHLSISAVREDELPMEQDAFNKLMNGWASSPEGKKAFLLAATATLRQGDVQFDSVWSNTQATQAAVNKLTDALEPPSA
jgi:hypothetical protein